MQARERVQRAWNVIYYPGTMDEVEGPGFIKKNRIVHVALQFSVLGYSDRPRTLIELAPKPMIDRRDVDHRCRSTSCVDGHRDLLIDQTPQSANVSETGVLDVRTYNLVHPPSDHCTPITAVILKF